MICVREYFPDTFSTRFGKNLAGSSALFSRALKPTMDLQPDAELLSLARPQRGNRNFVSFLAMLVMIQLLLLLAMKVCGPMPGISFLFSAAAHGNDSAVAKLWLDD